MKIDHETDFTAGLHGEGLAHARETVGDGLELLEALQVDAGGFDVRAGARAGIGFYGQGLQLGRCAEGKL